MSKFDYPILPRTDIIAILSDYGVTDANLLQPDPDFICNLYTQLLIQLDSLQMEDHEQMEFAALEILENLDHHVQTSQIINLSDKLNALVSILECPMAFTLLDLIKPDPDRTQVFLSTLLNFELHRSSNVNLINPIMKGFDHSEEQKVATEARISQLNEEIAEYEESKGSELPLVQEEKYKVNELRQTVSGLNTHQLSKKSTLKKLKEKVKEMDEKIANADFTLDQSLQENANLLSKIVQSPDKLQRALEDKKLVQTETKNCERAARQSYQEKTATVEAYSKACKKMTKHLAQIQAVQEQVNSAKTVDRDLKVLKSKLKDEGISDKSWELKLIDLQAKANQLDEMKGKLEKESVLRHEEANKELNNVKLEVESKRRALELRQREVESVVTEADAITSQINSVKEEGEAKMQELYQKCIEIYTEFFSYTKRINDCFPRLK